MGLILTTSLLIFILLLDTLRNQTNFHLKYNYETEQEKKRNKENKQSQTDLNMTDNNNPLHIMGQLTWKNEKEPPEYEAIIGNAEEDMLLDIKEHTHQTKQEIKDLRGSVKSLQKRDNNILPYHTSLT